jgi:membrane-associated phospholipid phosphatase
VVALVHMRRGIGAAGSHTAGIPRSGSGSGLRRVGRSAVPFAALAVIAVTARNGGLDRFEQKVVSMLRERRSPAVVAAARAVSALAEPGPAAGLLAVCTVMSARRAGWQAACLPWLTVASGMKVRRRLSQAVARPRPPAAAWLTEPEGFSLPSKHTTLAALMAGVWAASLCHASARRAGPLIAAAGVGASRVCLGVHWPSDVLAGWLFAEGWLRLARPAELHVGQRPT